MKTVILAIVAMFALSACGTTQPCLNGNPDKVKGNSTLPKTCPTIAGRKAYCP